MNHLLKYNQLVRLVMFLFISSTILLSCEQNLTDVSVSITVDSEPTAESFVVGDSINIQLSYNIPINTIDAKWYLNDTLYCNGSNFNFKSYKKEQLRVRHEAQNNTSMTMISYEFDIKIINGGNFLLNYATNDDIRPTIDYFNNNRIYENIIDSSNEDKKFGNKLVSGIKINDMVYTVSKTAPNLTCIDFASFESIWSASFSSSTIEAHDFIVINSDKKGTHGIISSSEGLYLVDLKTKKIGAMVSNDNTVYGDLHYYNNKLYAISKDRGLEIYSAILDKVQFIETIGMNALIGFAQTLDNHIWVGSGTKLVRIDPSDLSYIAIDFPEELMLYEKWDSWRNGTITSSSNTNDIYFAVTSRNLNGNKIYRYSNENPESLSSPFITGENNEIFCGESIIYDGNNDSLIALFTNTDITNGYKIVFFDPKTGTRTFTNNFTNDLNVYPSAIILDEKID